MTDKKEIARVMKALANHRRLEILSVLKKKKDITVSEIAEMIHLSLKSTSRHLAVLSAVHIVEREQVSLEVYYEISSGLPSLVRQVISML